MVKKSPPLKGIKNLLCLPSEDVRWALTQAATTARTTREQDKGSFVHPVQGLASENPPLIDI